MKDLQGVMAQDGADQAILITTGTLTPDAYAFAREKPITLIDGPRLQTMLGERVSASGEEA